MVTGKEDWEVAEELVNNNRTRHGLFFAHLALEKVLKAHVCKATKNFAPKIHSLLRLSEKAKLEISEDNKDILANMNRFNIAGRYAESLYLALSKTNAIKHLRAAKKTLKWLKNQL